jgi:hypothetical protein
MGNMRKDSKNLVEKFQMRTLGKHRRIGRIILK